MSKTKKGVQNKERGHKTKKGVTKQRKGSDPKKTNNFSASVVMFYDMLLAGFY